MLWSSVGNAALIFGLRLADVSVGTLRMTLLVRGLRRWAALVGFVEVIIWVTAIGRVMGQLESVWNILAYGAGYSAGTWLGMWIENRLALGNVAIHIFSPRLSVEIAQAVRAAGFGATEFLARGQAGPLGMVGVVAPRRRAAAVLELVRGIDAGAFVTMEEARPVMGGFLPVAGPHAYRPSPAPAEIR